MNPIAEECWLAFDVGNLRQFFGSALENFDAQLRMGDFTTPEHDGDFDLIPIFKLFPDASDFGFIIMFADFGAKSNLFKERRFLAFLSLALFLCLFVAVFTIVHEPAHRRNGGRSHLYEVEIASPGKIFSRSYGHYAQLFSVFTDHPDLTAQDFFVDSEFFNYVPTTSQVKIKTIKNYSITTMINSTHHRGATIDVRHKRT